VVQYAPDSANVSNETTIEQINFNRLSELSSVNKARRLAPGALTDDEFGDLIDMINRRYDKRIEQYRSGIKLWDFEVTTLLAISGTK